MKIVGHGYSKGMALTVAVVTLIILALVAAFAANFGYNQKKMVDTSSRVRDTRLYRAQGGVVHANWRIRVNNTAGLNPAGSFLNDAYDPDAYLLDVDGDGTSDTKINIGAVTNAGTKQRAIDSKACENPACVGD